MDLESVAPREGCYERATFATMTGAALAGLKTRASAQDLPAVKIAAPANDTATSAIYAVKAGALVSAPGSTCRSPR